MIGDDSLDAGDQSVAGFVVGILQLVQAGGVPFGCEDELTVYGSDSEVKCVAFVIVVDVCFFHFCFLLVLCGWLP